MDTDALGEMNDTLRIALLPSSSSASIAVKAVVGGNEYTVYRAPVTVTAGKYYYNSPIGARMVSGGDISYYTDVEQAVAAANASSSDAFITMLADHTIAGDSLKFLNASGRKISLDLGNSVLTGRSAIWSEVEFTASGSGYAQNNSNVVVVRSSGKFTMRGSSLVSTATAAANTSSPLCLYSESGTQFGEAAIDGTTVIGYSTYGAVYIFGCALTVSGEADFSAPRPLFVSTNGSLTVNGGTFNATSFTSQCIHIGASTSAVTINSGVFNANSRLFNFNSEKASAAKVVVTGGRFSWNGDFSGTWSGTNVAISGGLFSKEVPYGLATGYSCVTNPDPETAMEYPYTVLHD